VGLLLLYIPVVSFVQAFVNLENGEGGWGGLGGLLGGLEMIQGREIGGEEAVIRVVGCGCEAQVEC